MSRTNHLEQMQRIADRRQARHKNVRKRGFYGCTDQVIRLESVDHFPRQLRVSCPACGHEHTVKPAWRPYSVRFDQSTVPDIVLSSMAEGPA